MSGRRVLSQRERFELIWALKDRREYCDAAARMAEANDHHAEEREWCEKGDIAQRLHDELANARTVVNVVFEPEAS